MFCSPEKIKCSKSITHGFGNVMTNIVGVNQLINNLMVVAVNTLIVKKYVFCMRANFIPVAFVAHAATIIVSDINIFNRNTCIGKRMFGLPMIAMGFDG